MKLPIYLDYAATCPVDERVAKKMMEMFELIFPENSRKTLDEMRLNFADLTTIIEAAMTLVMGEEEAGEQ